MVKKNFSKYIIATVASSIISYLAFKQINIISQNKRFSEADFKNNLKGKFVVVTGGTSGLGESFAKISLKYGANVLIVGRNINELKKFINNDTLEEIDIDISRKEKAYIQADLSSIDGIKKAIKNIKLWIEKFNAENKIDYIYLNAGIGFHGSYDSITTDSAATLINVNTLAPISMSAELNCDHMIFISSPQGVISCMPNRSLYVASKHAVHGYAKSITNDGVPHVTSAYPMWIKTNLRKNSITADKNDNESQNHKNAAEPDDIAIEIMRDAILNRENSMLSFKIKFMRGLSLFFPKLAAKIIRGQFEKGVKK